MGYPQVKDFETGPIAGYWEEAIARDAAGFDFEVKDGRKAAERTRYQINAFRARAVEAGYHLAPLMQEFVVKIIELQGKVYIRFEKVFDAPGGLPRFLTAKEKKEQAEYEARAKAFAAAAEAAPAPAPAAAAAVELNNRARSYLGTSQSYEPQSPAAKEAHAKGAPEAILRMLDKAAAIRPPE